MLRAYRTTLTAAGGAGTSTASQDVRVGPGFLRAVRVDVGTVAATSDLTVTCEGEIVAKSDNITADHTKHPRVQTHKALDGAAIPAGDNPWDEPVVMGLVNLAIAQADNGNVFNITLFVEESN